MKELFLVRHAKSSWSELGLSDHDRPLNDRGERDAPEMGKRLAAREQFPDLLVSSTAVRARTTAGVIARELGLAEEDVLLEERLYGAEPDEILEVIQGLPESADSAMLFGHNPGLTYLANALGTDGIRNVPTCGIVHLVLPVERWEDVGSRRAVETHFDYPKKRT